MKMRWLIPALIVLLAACKNEPNTGKPTSTNAQTDAVLEGLISAVQQFPDSIKLADRLIDTLTNRGEYVLAAAWCDTLVVRDTVNNFIYCLVKADIFRQGKLYSDAIGAYEHYLSRKADEPTVYLSLANTMAEAGHPETLKACDMVWNRFQTPEVRTGLYFIKGIYFNTKKDYPQARRWMDSTLRYDYTFTDAYMEKGFAWYDEGKFANAAQTFAKLVEVAPQNAEGWYWLGKSYDTLQQTDKAIEAYQRCLLKNGSILEAKQAIERLSAKK